jgi:hypothetical protein
MNNLEPKRINVDRIVWILLVLVIIVYFVLRSQSQEEYSPQATTNSQKKSTVLPSDDFPPPIPGITYQDVSDHLKSIGISCEKPKADAIAYSGSCHGQTESGEVSIDVDIYSGNNPDNIYLILASVTQYKDTPLDMISATFLSEVAKLPISGVNVDIVGEWIEDNLPNSARNSSDAPLIILDDVIYHLACPTKTTRCLAIGQGSGTPEYALSILKTGSDYFPTKSPTRTPIIFATDIPVIRSTATLTPMPMGSVLTAMHEFDDAIWEIMVDNIVITNELSGYNSKEIAIIGRFAVLVLQVKNMGGSTGTFLPTKMFAIKDSNGISYPENEKATWNAEGKFGTEQLAHVYVDPGETINYAIVFDIPVINDEYKLGAGEYGEILTNEILLEIPTVVPTPTPLIIATDTPVIRLTPTYIPLGNVLIAKSDFNDTIWELVVDNIVITNYISSYTSTEVATIGRFAVLVLQVKNMGGSTDTFLPIKMLAIKASNGTSYPENEMATFYADGQFGTEYLAHVYVDPGETIKYAIVFDIPVINDEYKLGAGEYGEILTDEIFVNIP